MTERGMVKDEPVKAADDTCDATRMITAEWGPDVEPLTREEEIERLLPENLRWETIKDLPYSEGREMSRARAIAQAEAEYEQETTSEYEWFINNTV